MKAIDLITAMDLPSQSLVDKRVPKTLLVENGAPTAADKRLINEGIEELTWISVLKPATCGISAYRDDVKAYGEISVLKLTLRTSKKVSRLIELVHRAIPYPIVLVTEYIGGTAFSVAPIRWGQQEKGRVVLEQDVILKTWASGDDDEFQAEFLQTLCFTKQPSKDLYWLYQGWRNTLLAYKASFVLEAFQKPRDTSFISRDVHEAMQTLAKLEGSAARIRRDAKGEKQMAKRVEMNQELQRIEAEIDETRKKLKAGVGHEEIDSSRS